jgi:hypothetical protein
MSILKQWRCRHDRLVGIYGDEINSVGGARSACTDCGKYFKGYPPSRESAFTGFNNADPDKTLSAIEQYCRGSHDGE